MYNLISISLSLSLSLSRTHTCFIHCWFALQFVQQHSLQLVQHCLWSNIVLWRLVSFFNTKCTSWCQISLWHSWFLNQRCSRTHDHMSVMSHWVFMSNCMQVENYLRTKISHFYLIIMIHCDLTVITTTLFFSKKSIFFFWNKNHEKNRFLDTWPRFL